MSGDGTRRTIAVAFAANLGIAVAKLVVATLTRSAAMLAEALHSFADTGNQGLLFLGRSRGGRAPTAEHPFGYGAERYFWAFVVAVVLFMLGSVFALYEGVDKLMHPHEIESPEWIFAVLGLGIILEGLSWRTAVRAASGLRAGGSWRSYIMRATSPEIPVVLLEDTAALVGLVLALVGVTLAEVTGDVAFDAAGSIAIGLLLGAVAFVLAREMKSLLIGESAGPQELARVRGSIEANVHVVRLIHLRTMFLGPDELLVAAKVEFRHSSSEALSRAIDDVEAELRAAVPAAKVVYIEPDVTRPGSAASA